MEGAEGVVGGGGNSTGSPVAVRISLLCTCMYTCECARARVCVRKFVRSCGTQFAQSYCEADQQGDKRDTDVALALLPRSLLTSSKAKYKNYSSEVPRGASFLDSHLSCAMEGALSTAENQNVAPREAELP